jgi:uncharacterized membrane protein YheB (UPF0754 family)
MSTEQLITDIFQKHTTTDTTVHYNSDHTVQHKLATYRFLINRLHQLLLSQENKQKMNTILQITHNNGYPCSITTQLNNGINNKNQNIIPNCTHAQQ